MVGLLLAAVAVSWADTGTSDTGASVQRVTGTNTHTGAWAVHTADTGAAPTGESGGSGGHSGGGTTETDTDTDTDTDEPTDGTTDGTTTDDTATGDDKACGCATPGSGAAPAVLLGILAARRRRGR
jgi:MYXO-CTERM domain-containing protein